VAEKNAARMRSAVDDSVQANRRLFQSFGTDVDRDIDAMGLGVPKASTALDASRR
jgi:hypothetical protein